MAKLKLKTRKSAAKRFKITGAGKVMHRKQGKSHLLTGKRRKRKRQLKKDAQISSTEMKKIRRYLPYSL